MDGLKRYIIASINVRDNEESYSIFSTMQKGIGTALWSFVSIEVVPYTQKDIKAAISSEIYVLVCSPKQNDCGERAAL